MTLLHLYLIKVAMKRFSEVAVFQLHNLLTLSDISSSRIGTVMFCVFDLKDLYSAFPEAQSDFEFNNKNTNINTIK